tara:strand:+ start:33024 stop:33302 length:279 start_codon:yes stop_codon:yes gene_type:complete
MPEIRNKPKCTYSQHDIVMSAFACMYFQDPSFLAFQKRLENKLKSSNLKTLFDVKDIPKDTQLLRGYRVKTFFYHSKNTKFMLYFRKFFALH